MLYFRLWIGAFCKLPLYQIKNRRFFSHAMKLVQLNKVRPKVSLCCIVLVVECELDLADALVAFIFHLINPIFWLLHVLTLNLPPMLSVYAIGSSHSIKSKCLRPNPVSHSHPKAQSPIDWPTLSKLHLSKKKPHRITSILSNHFPSSLLHHLFTTMPPSTLSTLPPHYFQQ